MKFARFSTIALLLGTGLAAPAPISHQFKREILWKYLTGKGYAPYQNSYARIPMQRNDLREILEKKVTTGSPIAPVIKHQPTYHPPSYPRITPSPRPRTSFSSPLRDLIKERMRKLAEKMTTKAPAPEVDIVIDAEHNYELPTWASATQEVSSDADHEGATATEKPVVLSPTTTTTTTTAAPEPATSAPRTSSMRNSLPITRNSLRSPSINEYATPPWLSNQANNQAKNKFLYGGSRTTTAEVRLGPVARKDYVKDWDTQGVIKPSVAKTLIKLHRTSQELKKIKNDLAHHTYEPIRNPKIDPLPAALPNIKSVDVDVNSLPKPVITHEEHFTLGREMPKLYVAAAPGHAMDQLLENIEDHTVGPLHGEHSG